MKEIWRNMTLNLSNRDASRADMRGKFRSIIGLRGTWKSIELYPWVKYEICESPLLKSVAPLTHLSGPNAEEIWRKYVENTKEGAQQCECEPSREKWRVTSHFSIFVSNITLNNFVRIGPSEFARVFIISLEILFGIDSLLPYTIYWRWDV